MNLSRRQLISPHLADEVRTALTLSGVDPRRLILEITESVLMEDPERAALALVELQRLRRDALAPGGRRGVPGRR
ncbi:MAG: hypothetical protein ACLPQS_01420 [Acidimicrobiales bacterium]